jgi:hypothetical protein
VIVSPPNTLRPESPVELAGAKNAAGTKGSMDKKTNADAAGGSRP